MSTLDPEVTRLLARQAGVVARHQLPEHGPAAHDVRRLLRGEQWAHLLPGVHVDHRGPPTWAQRAWAAVLVAWPAALAGRSALRATAGPGWRGVRDHDPVEVAVDSRRTVVPPEGVVVRPTDELHGRVLWTAAPPRLRPEEATLDVVLDLLARAGPRDGPRDGVLDAVETLAVAVRARCTTLDHLAQALSARTPDASTALVELVLADLRDGTRTSLEQSA